MGFNSESIINMPNDSLINSSSNTINPLEVIRIGMKDKTTLKKSSNSEIEYLYLESANIKVNAAQHSGIKTKKGELLSIADIWLLLTLSKDEYSYKYIINRGNKYINVVDKIKIISIITDTSDNTIVDNITVQIIPIDPNQPTFKDINSINNELVKSESMQVPSTKTTYTHSQLLYPDDLAEIDVSELNNHEIPIFLLFPVSPLTNLQKTNVNRAINTIQSSKDLSSLNSSKTVTGKN